MARGRLLPAAHAKFAQGVEPNNKPVSMKPTEKPHTGNGAADGAKPEPRESRPTRATTNRENARLSTGPRTREGKAVTSQNATRHGFFSQKALIPGESPEEFEAFRAYHFSQLQPRGGVETLLVEQFVITCWRLQRLERIEAEAFRRYGLSSEGEVMGQGYAMIASIQGDNFLSALGRYEAGLRRQYFRCLDTMHSLRKSGQFPYLPPPVLLDVECASSDEAIPKEHDPITKVPSNAS